MTDSLVSTTEVSEIETTTVNRPNSGGLYDNIDLELLYQDYKNSYVEPNMNMVNTVYYIIMSADNA